MVLGYVINPRLLRLLRSQVCQSILLSLKSDALIEAEETKDGSFFVAQRRDFITQKQWLAFYAQSQGAIWVDGGAAEALSRNRKSLFYQVW